MNGSTWGSEDCLFLDVFVPEGLSQASAGTGVPVLHWLYGGGFFYGAKEWAGNPASLLEELKADGKFIIVASNYRLGPLGWMSSDKEPSMTPNAGLYDAWAALQWTKQYVHLFGGDPEKVTAMGQSAGSGMLLHFLAADAQGQRAAPFTQAILSSSGYRPHNNRSQEMTDIYNIFLNATQCEDVACLRTLSEEEMMKANSYMMLDAATGRFGGPSIGFGPIIDADLVQDLPERILSESQQKGNSQVKRIISGGMKNEGVGNEGMTWTDYAKFFARSPSNSTLQTLEELYGRYYNQSSFAANGTITPTPFDVFYGDIIFNCHAYVSADYWSKNQSGKTESYRYVETILPATHGLDLNYYFFDKNVAALDPTTIPDVAKRFQYYLRRFILGQSMEDWQEYGAQDLERPSWMNISAEGLVMEIGGRN